MRQVGYSGSQNGGSRSEVGGFEVKLEALGAKLVKYKILKKKIIFKSFDYFWFEGL